VRLPYCVERAYLVARGIPDDQDALALVSVELLGELSPPYAWELRLREGTGQMRTAVGRYDNEAEALAALQRVYDAYTGRGVWRKKRPSEPPLPPVSF
jgi:hypothetical protein